MEHQTYRRLHEDYMKNNNGTTIEETFATIVPSFFLTFLSVNLLAVTKPEGTAAVFGIEFILIVLSIVLDVTILHYRIWEVCYTLFFIVASAIGKQLYKRIHLAPFVQIPCKRPAYISVVRATINIITAVCILAVDFKSFPRKLAKTETFGFGLMDTGVGLFVFANAVIAPELYKAPQGNRLTFTKLQSILWNCSPLFVLGLARFVVVNEIDYQQHISEYGVHWNFFLTLAVTKILATIILSIIRKIEYAKYVAIALLTFHEATLQLGLEDYVISNDGTVQRDTFINANREGIVSILGYTSLYISSVFIGSLLRSEPTDEATSVRSGLKKTISARQLTSKTLRIFFLSLIFWKLSYAFRDLFGVSRRLANMGYVIWILSIATMITALFMVLEIFYYFIAFDRIDMADDETDDNQNQSSYIPLILNAINYNGLAFFLGANLLTGLVNIIFQTLLIEPAGCVLILTVYMFVLCAISTFLYLYKIQIRVW